MKILLTLLAVSVCADATINLAPLLDLLSPAPGALPVAAPVGPGEASYYRQARGPVEPGEASYYRQARGPVGPGEASYYRQAPAAVGPGEASYYRKAPAPVAPGEASYYRKAPAPAPAPAPGYASYYRQAPAPAPVPANSGYASYYRHAPAPAPKVASYYRQAPAPAPTNSGYASYYRKAAAPVAAPANSGYASYYRKAPAPAPVPVHVVPAEPSPIVRVIQPIIYLPRPTAKPASYYRHPAPPKESHVVLPPAVHTAAPVVSSTFTVQEPFTQTKVHHQTPAKTEFSIVPSESFSFSFPNANVAANSGAQVQSLPQIAINVPFNSASAGTTVQNLKANNAVETVKSEGHSYALPEERITIEKAPSQSFSYSYANADANSGAKVQSLPQTTNSYATANVNSGAQVQSLPHTIINQPFNLASAGASANTLQSDYSIQKSNSHSYMLPDEQITLQNLVDPETNDESAALQNLKLDIRGSKAIQEAPVAVVASADATAVVDDDNDDDDSSEIAPIVQTVAAAEEPASLSRPIVVVPTVETNAQAVAEVVSDDEVDEPEPVKQLAPVHQFAPVQHAAAPQPLATVTLDQEDITQQILQQAIPDVVNKVTPHLIQQAIPLIVDRAVPQIVYQVGEQQRKQAENVQIVTPFNHQQQQQKDDEKVFVMYATSLPQGQSQANFNHRGQFDVSENLVVPIGNRNQFNGAASSASAHANSQAHSGPKFVFEKGIDAGSYVEEERRSVGNVNQQIISNFQRENAAYQQEQRGRAGSQQQGGSFASASSFSGAGAQQNRGQFLNQSQQQYRQ